MIISKAFTNQSRRIISGARQTSNLIHRIEIARKASQKQQDCTGNFSSAKPDIIRISNISIQTTGNKSSNQDDDRARFEDLNFKPYNYLATLASVFALISRKQIANSESEQNLELTKIESILQNQSLDNATKVEQLKQLEASIYKPLIRQLAYKTTIEEVKELAIVLNNLGYLTKKTADLSANLRLYTDSAVFYQYVISIIKEKIDPSCNDEFYNNQIKQMYAALNQIKYDIIAAINTKNTSSVATTIEEESIAIKAILSKLRTDVADRLTEIEKKYGTIDENQDQYVLETRELFDHISQSMKAFLAKLYQDSEAEIGKPPCKYTVIGLGSLALEQITPYSDLEFAILTENDDYKAHPDIRVREYFKNLSHLAHLKIINLGETIIPTSRYGIDLSHLVHRAVNFDLGGKTSLGRIDNDKPYDLIQTIDLMLEYVINKENKYSRIDKTLPYILEKVCYIYGDENLAEQYKDKVNEFLRSPSQVDGMAHIQTRAIKLLKEGGLEYRSQDPEPIIIKSNLALFTPELKRSEGRLFDVKQQIYRISDRLINGLGQFYGIEGDSAWDTVDQLEQKKLINAEGAKNLKYIVTFANVLRLKIYAHYQAQQDYMSSFPKDLLQTSKQQQNVVFGLDQQDLSEQGRLFKFYYIAIPFHNELTELCENYPTLGSNKILDFFRESIFYKDDLVIDAEVYFRLSQFKKAQVKLEAAIRDSNYDNWKTHDLLGNVYSNLGDHLKAIDEYKLSLRKVISLYPDQNHIEVASVLNSLAETYRSLGQYDRAIEHYDQSLAILKTIYKGQADIKIFKVLNNLGLIYQNVNEYDLAINYHNQSLSILRRIYQDEQSDYFAGIFINLGKIYANQKRYDKAIECFHQSIEIFTKTYKNEPHLHFAGALMNLGLVYQQSKINLGLAIECLNKALGMLKILYPNEPHQYFAYNLSYLGAAYLTLEQYDKAIEYYDQSLKMIEMLKAKNLSFDEADSTVALKNLGAIYANHKQYVKAQKYFVQSLEIQTRIYNGTSYEDLAISDTLNDLSQVYSYLGQYGKSMQCSTENLYINTLSQSQRCLYIATISKRLGLD
jgi:tetratricopeptide (TPR) repeat protein